MSKTPRVDAAEFYCGDQTMGEAVVSSDVARKLKIESELARILLMHAVSGILRECGNSYANAYTEQWLRHAKSLGAYDGPVIGRIRDLEEEWEKWLDDNGGLPEWPDTQK